MYLFFPFAVLLCSVRCSVLFVFSFAVSGWGRNKVCYIKLLLLRRLHLIVDCDNEDTSCYFTRRARRWFEARNKCTAENADLAVLTRAVYHQLRRRNVIKTSTRYYIGLRRVYLRWTGPGPSKKLCILTCKIHSLNRFSDIVELILNIFVRCSLLYLRPDTQILRTWCNCVVSQLLTPPSTRLLTLDSRASLCLARLSLLTTDGAAHPSIQTF